MTGQRLRRQAGVIPRVTVRPATPGDMQRLGRKLIAHQTTTLGVRSSNLFGRASFWRFPCDSHGSLAATLHDVRRRIPFAGFETDNYQYGQFRNGSSEQFKLATQRLRQLLNCPKPLQFAEGAVISSSSHGENRDSCPLGSASQ